MKALLIAALALLLLPAGSRGEEEERYTEKDLPSLARDPNGPSEIDEFASGRGFRYARDTRRAARGDFKALKKFFEIAHDADGAAAESISGMPSVVYHLLGDEKLAQFLATQPIPYRMMVRNLIVGNGQEFSSDFPKSAGLLFQREMVGWFSPDDRYAIRKVFSDQFALAGSKVERADLIEKQTGRVLCDLTADDIGTGREREGEALWSSDSRRVACVSINLPDQPGSMFSVPPPPVQRKQTAVYQRAGDHFERVELSLGAPPGQENDPKLKGAAVGHIYTEPMRWRKPNALLLRRHEYYRVKTPISLGDTTVESITDLGRQFEITVTFGADGKANAVWKPDDQ